MQLELSTPTTQPTLGTSLAGALSVAASGVGLLLSLLKLVESDPEQGVVTPGEAREVLRSVERLQRRLDGARLRMIEHGRRHELPERTGFTGAGPWVSATTRTGGREGHLQAALAEDVSTTPATRSALDDGNLSAAHARVITTTLKQLPTGLNSAQRRAVEERLITLAADLDPVRLRRRARRILDVIEPDPAVVDAHENHIFEAEEDRALAATSFWMRDNTDGTFTGGFTVPSPSATILRKVLDAMTAPRRRNGTAPGQRHAAEALDWKLDNLAWQHRRGLAFSELLEHLPTDHLSGKVAATVLVHLDLDTLASAHRAARTDAGDDISAGQARRWACQAGIIPLVLGTDSVVLDQGRATRLFTQHQRLALSTQYTHCAAQHCDRPYAWCEIHHLTPWSTQPETDLANAVPLCPAHHRQIDRSDTTHTLHPGPRRTITVEFHRRT